MIRAIPLINIMTTPDERKAANTADDKEVEDKGLRCPKCGCRRATVDDTRGSLNAIKRIRCCEHCGCKYITKEAVFAIVQKRNTTGSN